MKNMVQHNADRCPKCDSQLVDPLAEENGIRRYQCRPCGHLYTAIIGSKHVGDVPGEPVNRLPDDPRMKARTPYKESRLGEALKISPFSRTALEVDNRKEATMASELVCPKGCGKSDFANTRSRGAHARHCDGTAKPSRAKTSKSRNGKQAVKVKLVKATQTIPIWSGTLSKGGITENLVAMLQDKRTQRLAEITAGDATLGEIDRILATLCGNPI